MRLNQFERQLIRQVVKELDPEAEVRLFGSRARDTCKGGDIDLLILSSVLTYHDKLVIRSKLKEHLGERKIDVIITKGLDSAFTKMAYEDGVVL